MCRGVIRPFLLSLAALPASSKISAENDGNKKNYTFICNYLYIQYSQKINAVSVQWIWKVFIPLLKFCDIKKKKKQQQDFHISCDAATSTIQMKQLKRKTEMLLVKKKNKNA